MSITTETIHIPIEFDGIPLGDFNDIIANIFAELEDSGCTEQQINDATIRMRDLLEGETIPSFFVEVQQPTNGD